MSQDQTRCSTWQNQPKKYFPLLKWDQSPKLPSFVHQSIFSKNYAKFYAVVKNVQECDFSEENLKKKLSDLAWLDLNVRSHVTIISMLMEDHTVIPFNFGTIYRSEESLKKFMGEYSNAIVQNLLLVEWKEEWAVKLYCNQDVMKAQIDNLSHEAAELEYQIMASSPGKAFLLTRKKADLIDLEIDRLSKSYGQEFFNEFNALSASAKLINIIPKEFSGRNDKMILNAAFLLPKDKTIEFVSLLGRLQKKYAGIGFELEGTGPWPPFSFVSIKENQ